MGLGTLEKEAEERGRGEEEEDVGRGGRVSKGKEGKTESSKEDKEI